MNMGYYADCTESIVDQTGGTVTITDTLYLGVAGSNAQYNLDGGINLRFYKHFSDYGLFGPDAKTSLLRCYDEHRVARNEYHREAV